MVLMLLTIKFKVIKKLSNTIWTDRKISSKSLNMSCSFIYKKPNYNLQHYCRMRMVRRTINDCEWKCFFLLFNWMTAAYNLYSFVSFYVCMYVDIYCNIFKVRLRKLNNINEVGQVFKIIIFILVLFYFLMCNAIYLLSIAKKMILFIKIMG